MNPLEESHASAGMPTITPPSPPPGRRVNQSFSIKLSDQPDDERSPDSPGNPLQWLQTNVITPTRTTLRRVSEQPMVRSLRDARSRLSFTATSRKTSPSATQPTLAAEDEPEGELPSTIPVPDQRPNPADSFGSLDQPPTIPVPDQRPNPADSFDSLILGQPPQTNSLGQPQNPADSFGSLTPPKQPSEIPDEVDPSRPPPAALEEKIKNLENKFETFQLEFASQAAEVNQGLGIITTTCDRLQFDIDSNAQQHRQEMTSLINNSEARTSTAMQALHDSSNRNADTLFNMMAAIKTDLDDRQPPALTDKKGFPPKAKAPQPDFKPLDQAESEDDDAALQAIKYAEQFILPGSSSMDSRVMAQFDISELDASSFARHKYKHADIKGYTEAVCKDDPSIEADYLTATCNKFGVERTAALQALRTKLGADSHREQQLGDLMILYLLTNKGASPIRESAIEACRDFIIAGHYEPKTFMERCRDGVSSLPLDASPEVRREKIERGLTVVKSKNYCAAMMTGIIFKMGYSHKPACDLQSMLTDFENFEQRQGEKAHEYVNRFQDCIAALNDATTLLDKSEYMPGEGTILSHLQKGANSELRDQAHHILRYIHRISLNEATYEQFKAALLEAQKFSSEDADLKAMKNKKPAKPTAEPPEDKKRDLAAVEEAKTNQAPALTHKLRDNKICVANVAFKVGKATKPCRHGEECNHQHLLPADIGLKHEDYLSFVVVYDHLKSSTAPEDKYTAVLHNGTIPPTNPTSLAVASPAVNQEVQNPADIETLQPPVSAPSIGYGAPLISMSAIRASPPPGWTVH